MATRSGWSLSWLSVINQPLYRALEVHVQREASVCLGVIPLPQRRNVELGA